MHLYVADVCVGQVNPRAAVSGVRLPLAGRGRSQRARLLGGRGDFAVSGGSYSNSYDYPQYGALLSAGQDTGGYNGLDYALASYEGLSLSRLSPIGQPSDTKPLYKAHSRSVPLSSGFRLSY